MLVGNVNTEDIAQKLAKAIIAGDVDQAKKFATELTEAGVNPIKIIEQNLAPAMRIVGEKFETMEYYLPELMLATDAMNAAVKILTANLKGEQQAAFKAKKQGVIVLGTVAGDIHDIGKNIVVLMLEINGFEVYDLGKDVAPMEFIKKAGEVEADIIGLSSLMTATKRSQQEVIELLEGMNHRHRYKVMVGGAPTSSAWAKEIRADAWAETAQDAVQVAIELLKDKTKN